MTSGFYNKSEVSLFCIDYFCIIAICCLHKQESMSRRVRFPVFFCTRTQNTAFFYPKMLIKLKVFCKLLITK